MDELALGEAGVEEPSEPFPQIVCVPLWPFGVGAIRFDIGLMVGFANLVKETFELAGEIQHPYLLSTA